MWVNMVAGFLGTFWIGAAYGTPLPLFLQAVQASGLQLGLMGAVRQLALLAQLPGAFFVERQERRKTFWAVLVIAHRFDAGCDSKSIATQATARLANQGRTVCAKAFSRHTVNRLEDRVQINAFPVNAVVGEAAAHVQTGNLDASTARNHRRFADVRRPSFRIGALRAGVEGDRGHKARIRRGLEQFRRHFCCRAKLRAKVVSSAFDRQFEAHRNLAAFGRHHFDQLGQLAAAVDRPRRHIALNRKSNLGARADGVVVMDRCIRIQTADQVNLKRRGAVKPLHTRRDQVFNHFFRRVGLDGIGHKARKSLQKTTRGRLHGLGRKKQHRILRLLIAQVFGRIGPDRFGQSHRRIPFCQQDACPSPLP